MILFSWQFYWINSKYNYEYNCFDQIIDIIQLHDNMGMVTVQGVHITYLWPFTLFFIIMLSWLWLLAHNHCLWWTWVTELSCGRSCLIANMSLGIVLLWEDMSYKRTFLIGRYFLCVMVPLWYDITYQVNTGGIRKRFKYFNINTIKAWNSTITTVFVSTKNQLSDNPLKSSVVKKSGISLPPSQTLQLKYLETLFRNIIQDIPEIPVGEVPHNT